MEEIISYILLIIGISLPPVITVLLNHYFQKKKLATETKKIQLQNKITAEITYDQLKTESKQKDIKNKIEIFRSLNRLEEEIRSKENKTEIDQKKLESLELIMKEFKEDFMEKGENLPMEEKRKNLQEKESAKKQKLLSPKKKRTKIKK